MWGHSLKIEIGLLLEKDISMIGYKTIVLVLACGSSKVSLAFNTKELLNRLKLILINSNKYATFILVIIIVSIIIISLEL